MLRRLAVFILFMVVLPRYEARCQPAGKDSAAFCGKKWYCEMTKDADGNIHPTEAGRQDDYMYFMCDSTFLLIENDIVLKGRWVFDSSAMIITLHQDQLDYIPDSFSYHIIDYDDTHMVIIGREGTNGAETAHLFTK